MYGYEPGWLAEVRQQQLNRERKGQRAKLIDMIIWSDGSWCTMIWSWG